MLVPNQAQNKTRRSNESIIYDNNMLDTRFQRFLCTILRNMSELIAIVATHRRLSAVISNVPEAVTLEATLYNIPEKCDAIRKITATWCKARLPRQYVNTTFSQITSQKDEAVLQVPSEKALLRIEKYTYDRRRLLLHLF